MLFPFISQAIFFSAPVVYSTSLSIDNDIIEFLFQFNPLAGVLNQFRAGVFAEPIDPLIALMQILFASLIFVSGLIWFKVEDQHLIDRL